MSFFCTLFYAFFILVRPQDWLWPVLIDYRMVNIIAIVSLGALAFDVMNRRVRIPEKLPHLWLELGVYFGIIMSHVAHTYWWGIQGASQEYGKKLIFFLLVLLTVNTAKRMKFMFWVIVIVACIMTYHCHLQITTGHGFAGWRPLVQLRFQDGEWLPTARAYFFGTFEDPNDTALFLVSALPLAFALFPGKLGLLLGMPVAAWLIYGVDLTKSRGGQIGLIVALGLLFHKWLSPKKFMILMAAGIIVFTELIPLAAKFGFVDQSALDRAIFWGEANYYFKANPIFGVGYAMLSSDYMEKDRAVHNSYVLCYTETGVFGYTFWFTLLALSFFAARYVSRLIPEDKEEKHLIQMAIFMVPALGGYYAASYFLTRAYHLPFLLLMALAGAFYRITAEKMGYGLLAKRLHFTMEKFWLYPAISLGSIVFIYISIRLINAL